jgi:hypothetical protein
MNNAFSDRATFLAALAPLSGALFTGGDLSYDAAARTMTLTLTHQGGGGAGAGLFGRKGLQTSRVTVHRIESYKQSLTGAEHEGYVLDRAEVSRGGRELAFYFRPGDRAVMDVAAIDGTVEALGAAASAPRRQPNVNPLMKEELERAARNRSLLGRLLGRQP